MESLLHSLLQQKGYRTGRSRLEVFDTLSRSNQPLSIVEIAKLCKMSNQASVYRVIDLFRKLDIVSIHHYGNKTRYTLRLQFKRTDYSLSCTNCGLKKQLHPAKPGKLLNKIAKEHQFTPWLKIVSISGLCARCSGNYASL
jgi:Fe2+ or Zn2+ uptake regulation protein